MSVRQGSPKTPELRAPGGRAHCTPCALHTQRYRMYSTICTTHHTPHTTHHTPHTTHHTPQTAHHTIHTARLPPKRAARSSELRDTRSVPNPALLDDRARCSHRAGLWPLSQARLRSCFVRVSSKAWRQKRERMLHGEHDAALVLHLVEMHCIITLPTYARRC